MTNQPEKKPNIDSAPDALASPAAANGNEPAAADATAAPAKKYGRGKKALSISFNIAAGFAAAAAAKAIVAVPMTLFAAPAVATLLVSSIAVGAAMTAMCHAGQTYSARKKGVEGPKFWTKQNRNTFLKSSGFALVGGALFMGFGEGLFDRFFGTAPEAPAPVMPVIETAPLVSPTVLDNAPNLGNLGQPDAVIHTTAPAALPDMAPDTIPDTVIDATAPLPCPTPMESFGSLIDGHSVSERVTDAMSRAASDSATVAAQGTKDLAYFAFNGFDGVPQSDTVAAGLFQQAAESGNVQAKIDLLYMQYHGLGGVAANPDAAIAAMNDIATPRAEMFVQQWGGTEKITERVAFDTKAILSGVKLCPTP